MIVGLIDEARSRELRRAVLRPGLAPGDPLPGDERPDAVHFGAAEDDGTVVATCFLYPQACPWRADAPAWHLRQMATADGRRSRGIGAQVLTAAVEHVAAQGARLVWCNARERAVPFYARHGFVPHGEVFTDERHPIPHLRMSLEIRHG